MSFGARALLANFVFMFAIGCAEQPDEVGMSPSDNDLDQAIFSFLLAREEISFRKDRSGYFYVAKSNAQIAKGLMREASAKQGRRVGIHVNNICEETSLIQFLDEIPLPYVIRRGIQTQVWMRDQDVQRHQVDGNFALISHRCSGA